MRDSKSCAATLAGSNPVEGICRDLSLFTLVILKIPEKIIKIRNCNINLYKKSKASQFAEALSTSFKRILMIKQVTFKIILSASVFRETKFYPVGT